MSESESGQGPAARKAHRPSQENLKQIPCEYTAQAVEVYAADLNALWGYIKPVAEWDLAFAKIQPSGVDGWLTSTRDFYRTTGQTGAVDTERRILNDLAVMLDAAIR